MNEWTIQTFLYPGLFFFKKKNLEIQSFITNIYTQLEH